MIVPYGWIWSALPASCQSLGEMVARSSWTSVFSLDPEEGPGGVGVDGGAPVPG